MRAVSVVLLGVAASFEATAFAKPVNMFANLDYPTLLVAQEAVQEALETHASGEVMTWRVPDVASGTVEPVRTWKSRSGHWCRAYRETLEMRHGPKQSTSGVRCRVRSSWRVPD